MHYEWSQVIVAGLSAGVGFGLFIAALGLVGQAAVACWSLFRPKPDKSKEIAEENARCDREYAVKLAMRFYKPRQATPADLVAAAEALCSYLDGSHVKSSAPPLKADR